MAKRRTPAEIARDELNDTVGKITTLKRRLGIAQGTVDKLTGQIKELEALRDYQRQHPLLRQDTGYKAEPAVDPGLPLATDDEVHAGTDADEQVRPAGVASDA